MREQLVWMILHQNKEKRICGIYVQKIQRLNVYFEKHFGRKDTDIESIIQGVSQQVCW